MIAKAFASGMNMEACTECEIIELGKLNISHCAGCFGCWKVTPGKCVIKDDMQMLTEKIMESDNIILSFPLYFFGLPSTMVTMLNRLLPLKMPYKGKLATEDNPVIMDYRYDLSGKKLILVSSCAHASTDIVYEPIKAQFDMICGKNNYTTIFCPQGEILMLDKMRPILNNYLSKVSEAGKEFAKEGRLSTQTHDKVCAPLIPVRAVEKMMTGYWEEYPQ